MPREKVLRWLESSGFPLEMAAANAFRREKFEVRQSTPYLDPETDKGREMDVLVIDPDIFGAVEINFVVECKSSSKPWIVLASDDAFGNYNRFSAFSVMSESARIGLVEKFPNLGCMRFIERENDGGYGFRQALSEGGDAAFTAAMSVLKACSDLVRAGERKSYKPLVFAFPIVVVDTPLFECRLLSDGQLELKEVRESEFLFTAHIPKATGCSVRVVTKSALPQFANRAREISKELRVDLKDEEAKVISSFG